MTFTFTFLCRLQRGGRTLDWLVFISNSMFVATSQDRLVLEEAVPYLQERCFKMSEHPSMQKIKNTINLFLLNMNLGGRLFSACAQRKRRVVRSISKVEKLFLNEVINNFK